MFLEESATYHPVAHLCLENLRRLRRRLKDGDLSLSEFHRYRDAILFQYDSLPSPLRREVLHRLERLGQQLDGR